jgi:ADP-ribosylglycohydrolase
MTLTTAQLDRACGVLLSTAAGDALGAAYEFGPPRGPELEVAMVGGGAFGWEPGEWTDDTSMAIAIAEVAATGADPRQEESLDAITRRWHEWSRHARAWAYRRARYSAAQADRASPRRQHAGNLPHCTNVLAPQQVTAH